MVQKVSLYFILPMCFVAFFLSLFGVTHIDFGNDYYTFIAGVSKSFESWKLEIPDIPKIPSIVAGDYDKSGLILGVLIKIANFFVGFVNVISTILNIVISIVNILIQIVQFILTLIYSTKDFINKLRSNLFAYV